MPRVSNNRLRPSAVSMSRRSPATIYLSLQMPSTTARYLPDGDAAGHPCWSFGVWTSRHSPVRTSMIPSRAVYHSPSPGPGETTAANASLQHQVTSQMIQSGELTRRTSPEANTKTQAERHRKQTLELSTLGIHVGSESE